MVQRLADSHASGEAGDKARRKSRLPLIIASSLVCALALAGCASTGKSGKGTRKSQVAEVDPKLGVAPSPRLVEHGKPVPKGGGRNMVGKPYKVAGKRYVPKLDPDYAKVGMASWYGNAFHGRKTANGEIFDSNHLSAAHTTMPLPSYARVTNVSNGRSVIVRVNDRGPFHSNRLIDLSRKAADLIGIRTAGVGKVKVEYVGPAPVSGDDTAYLMASYRGPSDIPVSQPEVMVADAEPSVLPGVIGAPVAAVASLVSTASDDAEATAVADAAPAAGEPAATAVAAVDGEFPPVGPMIGPVMPKARPAYAEDSYITVAVIDPADVWMSGGTMLAAAPLPPITAVGYTPDTATEEPPADVDSYVADRVARTYAAFAPIDDAGQSLRSLVEATAAPRGPVLQVGLFANPDNAARIADELAGTGKVIIDELVVDGRALSRVRVTGLTVGVAAAVAAAEAAGANGAHILR